MRSALCWLFRIFSYIMWPPMRSSMKIECMQSVCVWSQTIGICFGLFCVLCLLLNAAATAFKSEVNKFWISIFGRVVREVPRGRPTHTSVWVQRTQLPQETVVGRCLQPNEYILLRTTWRTSAVSAPNSIKCVVSFCWTNENVQRSKYLFAGCTSYAAAIVGAATHNQKL